METMLEKIAVWSSSVTERDIPDRIRFKARLQLLSTLGAIGASARHDIGRRIIPAVKSWAGNGPCRLLTDGQPLDVLSAIYGNSALSLALDYDDYLLFGHTGHSAVCVSMAMAEREGRSLGDVLTAQIVANEIAGRLGASVVIGPHNGQTWSYLHLLGAAAAASKLMDLSAERTAHAMAIALYQPPYVLFPGFMGPDSKATTAATPSITGVQAAILASRGATGPLDILEHPQGFLKTFAFAPAPFFISGFGKAWTTDTLAYKIYPGCAYIDTTIDAALLVRDDFRKQTGRELDPDEIEEIRVDATLLTLEMNRLSRIGGRFDPLNPVSMNFSIPGNIAIALMKGRLTPDDLRDQELQRRAEAICRLSERVSLKHDWEMTFDMLRTMGQVLDLPKALSGIPFTSLLKAVRRIRSNYGGMDMSLSDIRGLTRQAAKMSGKILFLIGGMFKGEARNSHQQSGYDLGRCNLEAFRMPFSAIVMVRTRKGETLKRRVDIPVGAPGRKFDETKRVVIEKWLRETGKAMDGASITDMQDRVDRLEQTLTLEELIRLSVENEVI